MITERQRDNRQAVASIPQGVDLYMRYLGVLRVLGEAAVYVDNSDVEEMIHRALLDATIHYPVTVTQILKRYDVEPSHD